MTPHVHCAICAKPFTPKDRIKLTPGGRFIHAQPCKMRAAESKKEASHVGR